MKILITKSFRNPPNLLCFNSPPTQHQFLKKLFLKYTIFYLSLSVQAAIAQFWAPYFMVGTETFCGGQVYQIDVSFIIHTYVNI